MTQRSVTYLKGRFETGDVPTQSDYGDLMDSFVNLETSANQTMAGNLTLPSVSVSALTANKVIHANTSVNATGTTQGSAATLNADMTFLVVTDAERAAILPYEAGRRQYITNSGTTAASIFPQSGRNFVGTAANAALLLAAGGSMTVLHCAASAYGVIRTQAV